MYQVAASTLLGDGKTWYRGTSLTGTEGDVQFDGSDYTIVLDEVAVTGVTTVIPVPATAVLLIAAGRMILSQSRRQA